MLPFFHVNIRGVKRQNYNKFSYGCNLLLFDSSVRTASILKSKMEIPMRRQQSCVVLNGGDKETAIGKTWLTLATRFP